MSEPAGDVSDRDLERFLDGNAPEDLHVRIDAAVRESSALRERLAALQRERAISEALRESQAIRLPASEEARIVERGLAALSERLGPALPPR